METIVDNKKIASELVRLAKIITADMDTVYRLFPNGSYLNMFFKEKRIPDKMWDIEDKDGVTHTIPNAVVMEFIAATTGSERRKIEDTLRKIDFANGDVNHFLKHLAGAIAEMYGNAF